MVTVLVSDVAILNGFFVDTLHWRHLWLLAALIWAASSRRPWPSSSSR